MSSAQAERLRAALLDPLAAQEMAVAGSQAAAVLVALFERDPPPAPRNGGSQAADPPSRVAGGELHAVFTRRRPDLRIHAGQVSFPGGRRDPADADLVATALREAHEEIGLDPAAVTLLGALRPTPTVVSDIAIYPIVGLIAAPTAAWVLAAAEVEAVIEAPLAQLSATHHLETFTRPGGRSVTTDAYTIGEDTIWGATARILADLLARLRLEPAGGPE
jgi:8-oxo-dGTP pyrophosphatase MutT (NUDIX family)